MAEAAVSLAVEKLGEWLREESQIFFGVHEHVRQLQVQLKDLQGFLKDADAKQHKSNRVRNCVKEIREIAYDAEDIIETFVLHIESRREACSKGCLERVPCLLSQAGIKGCLEWVDCFLSEVVMRRKVGLEIKNITARISKAKESMQELGIQEIMDIEDSSSVQEREREIRESFPYIVESDLVGLQQNTEELAADLVNETKQFRVMSICGMGGLGKTTLARQVFNHNKVRRHFDRFAWVYISQTCQRRNVWQEILVSICPKSEQSRIRQMHETELAQELYKFLKRDKCLIVLDDMWRTETWDFIKHVFHDKTGSRIILTTRNEYIALYADPRGILFKPKCLNDDQSWELLQKITFGGRDSTVDKRIEEIGKQILEHCGGLPLALRVLGGILAGKPTLSEWQRVHEDIKSYIASGIDSGQNNSSVYSVLSLSYDELPSHLKQCFLYLGLFPEDYMIEAQDLTSYWIAEGLILPEQRSGDNVGWKMEDVAYSYLEDLAKRSMVFVRIRNYDSRIGFFQLHDLIRESCLLKAKQENFLRVMDLGIQTMELVPFSSAGNFRRLAVHLEGTDEEIVCQKHIESPQVRSLLCICKGSRGWTLSEATFSNLKLLRVLDMSEAQFEGGKLAENIGEIVHLRYLNLSWTNLSELPSSLGNLRLMLYLDIRIAGPVHVPNVIWKMKRLRRLLLPWEFSDETKLDLGNLINLKKLDNFSVEHCNVMDLVCLRNLTELSIIIHSGVSVEMITSSISTKLKQIREFSISSSLDDLATPVHVTRAPVDVTRLVSDFGKLSWFGLGIKMKKLPDPFPCDISSVSLFFCELEQDPMLILGNLPNLMDLEMDTDTFIGRKMFCSRSSFPKLQRLSINGLHYLREWTIEEGAMPVLNQLTIRYVTKLEVLPNGLRYVTNLQWLEISSMPKAFTDKYVPGGEDFDKVRHVPSIVFN